MVPGRLGEVAKPRGLCTMAWSWASNCLWGVSVWLGALFADPVYTKSGSIEKAAVNNNSKSLLSHPLIWLTQPIKDSMLAPALKDSMLAPTLPSSNQSRSRPGLVVMPNVVLMAFQTARVYTGERSSGVLFFWPP